MFVIDIKKYIVMSLLLVSTTTVILPSASEASCTTYQAQTVATRYEYEIVEFDDEEGLIDAHEQINPKKLVNGWVMFLSRASKYLFIVANRVYIWWYGSARRNIVRG